MQRIKVIGLALVAVFAISAVTAGAASASKPEFEPKGKTFTITYVGKGTNVKLQKSGGFGEIECSAAKSSGTLTNATVGTATITFTGCKDSIGGTCTSKGAPNAGEIISNKLESLLVYAPKKTEVGVVLAPEGSGLSTSETITTVKTFTPLIECGGFIPVNVEVRKGLIGKIPSVELNAFKTTFKLEFASPKVGVQTIEEYEKHAGGVVTGLHLESNENGGAFAAADEVATGTLEEFKHGTTLEEVKINA